jgi:hypothetical protein
MIRLVTAVAALLCFSAIGVQAQDSTPKVSKPIVLAQESSCSGWKSVCETRGGGCESKYTACLKSGCWTEAAKFGGGTHCGLSKR